MELLLHLFFEQLVDEQQYIFLQQDSATACTTRAPVNPLNEVFGDRIIIGGLWPVPQLMWLLFMGNHKTKQLQTKLLHNSRTEGNDNKEHLLSFPVTPHV
jgi:hypothetical protein